MAVKLSKRESDICTRLREARELVGLSQGDAARKIGISRERLHLYEYKRAPLRFEIALRFCREFIISEEWLATGRFDLIEAEADRLKIGRGPELHRFYVRQCLDLQSEPEFFQIPPGTLFSEAYDDILASKYAGLIRDSFYLPRLVTRGSDSNDLLIRYLAVVNQCYLVLLQNEANRHSRGVEDVRRIFMGAQVLFGEVLFKRFMAVPTPEVAQPEYKFLRAIAKYVDVPIGPIHVQNAVVGIASRGNIKHRVSSVSSDTAESAQAK
jgi:transcriptional regulator with XRE-family HTH domain